MNRIGCLLWLVFVFLFSFSADSLLSPTPSNNGARVNGAASGADEQLKIAFVTGNKMKVSLRGVETSTGTIIDSQIVFFIRRGKSR